MFYLIKSLGAMSKINDIYDEDGNTAHIVKMAGGIPFVKSNYNNSNLLYNIHIRTY